jgi:hypothetical protein
VAKISESILICIIWISFNGLAGSSGQIFNPALVGCGFHSWYQEKELSMALELFFIHVLVKAEWNKIN